MCIDPKNGRLTEHVLGQAEAQREAEDRADMERKRSAERHLAEVSPCSPRRLTGTHLTGTPWLAGTFL